MALCTYIHLYGQNQKLDSLLKAYKKANHDTTRIQLLLSIGDTYYYDNPDTAFFYYNKAFDLSTENNPEAKIGGIGSLQNKYATYQAISLKNLGFIYKEDKGDCDKAIDYFLKALNIFKELNDKKGISSCYTGIGIVYAYQGSYDKAIEYYLKALKIFEELGYKQGMSANYTNIGIVYSEQGNFNKAIDYYMKSLKINEELGNKNDIAGCYINIGIIYGEKRSCDSSIEYFQKSLKIFDELKDKYGSSQCYDNIGNVYQIKGNYNKAIDYIIKSMKIKEEIDDKHGMVACYNNIGSINITLADSTSPPKNLWHKYLNKAVEFGTKAIILAKINFFIFLNSF